MVYALKKAYLKGSSNVWSLLANIVNSFVYMVTSIVLVLTFTAIKQTDNIFSRNFLLCLFFGFQASTNLFWIFFMGIINYPFERIDRTDDKYFLYPRSILSSILLDSFAVFDVSLFFINYCLFFFFGIKENIFFIFLIIPIFGTLTLAACFIILASLIFKTRIFQNSANLIFMITEMAQYPASIYPLPVKIVLIFIPLSFVTYYPLQFIVQKKFVAFFIIMASIFLFYIATTQLFKFMASTRKDIYD